MCGLAHFAPAIGAFGLGLRLAGLVGLSWLLLWVRVCLLVSFVGPVVVAGSVCLLSCGCCGSVGSIRLAGVVLFPCASFFRLFLSCFLVSPRAGTLLPNNT